MKENIANQIQSLVKLNFNNQRIMTTKVLAEQFGTEDKIISNNFNRNIERFVQGKHYYKLEGKELKEFKTNHLNDEPSLLRVNCLYLWTERGAARHAKILDTDEAWDIYEALEENYFNDSKIDFSKLSSMDLLKLSVQALEENKNEIREVKQDLKDFKKDIPLFNIECSDLQNIVKGKGTSLLGGKKSPAYQDKSIRQRVYSDIQREIKRQFDVRSYKAIKRKHLDIAKEIVQKYQLPYALEQEIKEINQYGVA